MQRDIDLRIADATDSFSAPNADHVTDEFDRVWAADPDLFILISNLSEGEALTRVWLMDAEVGEDGLSGSFSDVSPADLAGEENGFQIGAKGTLHQFRYLGTKRFLRVEMRES